MPWIELIVIAAVLVGVALMAGGRGDGLAAAPPDRPDLLVESQSGPLTAEHVKAARFGVGFRGYRMDEVDALLDRLADQLPAGDSADAGDAGDADDSVDQTPIASGESGVDGQPDAPDPTTPRPELGSPS